MIYNAPPVTDLFLAARAPPTRLQNKGPNTNRSQFFISYGPAPHLDNVYTVFGRVVDGFNVLNQMEALETDAKGRSARPVIIKDVVIHANPFAVKSEIL